MAAASNRGFKFRATMVCLIASRRHTETKEFKDSFGVSQKLTQASIACNRSLMRRMARSHNAFANNYSCPDDQLHNLHTDEKGVARMSILFVSSVCR